MKDVHILRKGHIFKVESTGCETKREVLTDSIHQVFWLHRSKVQAVGSRVHSQYVHFHVSPPGVPQSTNLLVAL